MLEYVGEVLTTEAYHERLGTTYAGRQHYHCLHLDGGLVIDGGLMGTVCVSAVHVITSRSLVCTTIGVVFLVTGGEARFVNHSCDPNCHIEKW